jgi:hypothetical protein
MKLWVGWMSLSIFNTWLSLHVCYLDRSQIPKFKGMRLTLSYVEGDGPVLFGPLFTEAEVMLLYPHIDEQQLELSKVSSHGLQGRP